MMIFGTSQWEGQQYISGMCFYFFYICFHCFHYSSRVSLSVLPGRPGILATRDETIIVEQETKDKTSTHPPPQLVVHTEKHRASGEGGLHERLERTEVLAKPSRALWIASV